MQASSVYNAGHAANVVSRALIPIFGVIFFGWSGTKLLVVFFADTLASIYALSTLVLYATATSGAEYENWVKDGLTPGKRLRIFMGVAALPLPLLLIIGFFFGILPLFVMLDMQSVRWGDFLADRDLWIAVACQFAAALTLLVNQLGWVRSLEDPQRFFKYQLGLLCARWGAMMLVGFFAGAVIPRSIYGPLLIITYAAATVALELAPSRVMELLGRWLGRDEISKVAKPPASALQRQSTRQ